MIERIYIPTVRRADNQITFNNLPKELQEKVIMVVEPGERHLYNYDCEYLVIPEEIVGSWTQLAQTREFIYRHAGSIKYAMMDDDLTIIRRNSKYFTGESNMEKSKRYATPEEYLECFDTMSKYLDEPDIGLAGLNDKQMFPSDKVYKDTSCFFYHLFIDGEMLSKIIDDIDCTSLRVSEDTLFLAECLSRGINTRVSNEWLLHNRSQHTKDLNGTRIVWEGMFDEDSMPKDFCDTDAHYDALKFINEKHPGFITFYEKNGKRYNTKKWKKLYKPQDSASLDKFMETSL